MTIVLAWFPAVAGAPVMEKQVTGIDSALLHCAGLPETRMKEVAPFVGVAERMIAKHPEIISVLRTNSKGIIVNCVRCEGRVDGQSLVRSDVSGTAWFSGAKSAMNPYYGLLPKENKRVNRIWSRPVSIGTAAGAKRFGGVVAVILTPARSDEGAPAARAGAQKSLVAPGPDSSSVPPASSSAQRASGKQDQDGDSEYSSNGNSVSRQPVGSGGGEAAFMRTAGICALIVVAFCLWLIISTLRKRKKPGPSAAALQESTTTAGLAIDEADAVVQYPANESLDSGIEIPTAVANPRPAYAAIPAIQPAASEDPAAQETVMPDRTEKVQIEVSALDSAEHAEPEAPEESREKPVQDAIHANDPATQQAFEECVAELRAEMRAAITDEQRAEIYKKEVETMTSAIRQQFASELHQHIVETMSQSLEQQERAAVTREVADRIRSQEYETVLKAERRALSETVRAKLAEEESANFAAEARETLKNEIFSKVRQTEEEAFVAQARDEMAADIRRQLLEQEKESIAGQQRRNLEAELYTEVSAQQREAIRESVVKEIIEEEHQRVGSDLRKTIVEEETNRILAEESPGIREQIQETLRDEEAETMRRAIRDEIYSETVQAIKRNIEDKYRSVVEEKIGELRESLHRKTKADLRAAIGEDYDRLMERAEGLSASLTNVEALQSLSQTVTLLTDEKKKYKYLNLNAAQTESLLEYLRRVHNRFNIFFDKVDESVRELMLGLGSVKNKLSNKE